MLATLTPTHSTRSYYPIFPPPASSDAPIDLRYMKQFQFEKTPDVLLLPSILNRFCGVRASVWLSERVNE